jgi:hypothetical protein
MFGVYHATFLAAEVLASSVHRNILCPKGRRCCTCNLSLSYCPDFNLIDNSVYIEHFGVRRQKMADGGEQLTTAPFVDRESYRCEHI